MTFWQSTCCRWIVQQSCDSVLVITHRCHCEGHSLQHLSSWANRCSNETNVHSVLQPSRHTKHQINEWAMDGFWCDWQQVKSILKLSDLKFLRFYFFLSEEDNKYPNIFGFLFHKFIKHFWFLSCLKHHRHKRSESAKADVPQWRNLLSWPFLFLRYVWQVDSKRNCST